MSTLPTKETVLNRGPELEHQPLMITTTNTRSPKKKLENNDPISLPVDEGPSPFMQDGVAKKNLQQATVTYLDGSQYVFYVHKNAEGEILFDMVANQLNLTEKDYFALAFYDEQSTSHWLYKDKRIAKQLKGLPWNFSFEVKFYPPQPSQLADDLTRYLLCLQLRRDVYKEKLPVSFVTQAKLGCLAAQSEYGDYNNSQEYANYLKNAKIAQVMTAELMEKIQELHKQNKGQTPADAELAYLNECKELAMYGVTLFPAKDSKGKPVQIGISSHGISVYNDQMRLHRFAWANIIKFSYRRNNFSIKLKPGELDKKDTVANYKLADYPAAKRLWKCGVEHHTFFRLIQPEVKPKNSFLSFGSHRFRYQGRTNIQSHMASQLFDNSVPVGVERASSGRIVSKSADDIAVKSFKQEPTSPMHYADDGSRDPSRSPEKAYHIAGQPLATSTAKKRKEEESSLPHTTVHTWHETSEHPETVSTEVDEHGNVIRRTIIKSEQVKHTVKTQSYQTYAVDENTPPTASSSNIKPKSPPPPPQRSDASRNGTSKSSVETHSRTVAYENGITKQQQVVNGANEEFQESDLVSSKAVTTGNRTVETRTYKKEKDGVIETHVEHRITIHSGEEIDHDAELSRAIIEATNMNPEMTVEKVEVKQERH